MRILQWNVWCLEEPARIVKAIEELRPDVLCLQEVTPELAGRLSGFHQFWAAGTFGVAILSRYPILGRVLHIIQTPDPTRDPEDFSNHRRICIEATIQAESETFVVASTHMSYTPGFADTPAKAREADNLVAIARRHRERFVLAGDLNATPQSYTVHNLLGALSNAGPHLSEPTWPTKPFSYNGFEAEAPPRWRIDYCLVTPDVGVQSAEIVATPYSDHLPILVQI